MFAKCPDVLLWSPDATRAVVEAPAPLRPFFASIFDAALPDLDLKFSFYNIRFPKLAASRGERSLDEKHQTQKERPLLVAWQRPLLRTAEHSGPSSCESRITPPARSHCDGGHKICDWYLTTGAKARAPKFGHWGGSRFSVVPQRWPIAAPFQRCRPASYESNDISRKPDNFAALSY